MSTPLCTIITPTHNRPKMFAECARAVLAQTFKDWTWWVVFNKLCWPKDYDRRMDLIWDDSRFVPIWFPVSEGRRFEAHVPSQIINWLYPKVTTPYIYFLADDDLIDPDGLGALVKEMGINPVVRSLFELPEAVYGRCEVVDQQPDGSYKHGSWCYDAGDVGLETGIDPHCLLDGGQVLHTKALWDRATAPEPCSICQGRGWMGDTYCGACGGSKTVSWQLSDTLADAGACDGLLLARMAQFTRFHYVPQKIVTHRRHRGAACHKPQLTSQ